MAHPARTESSTSADATVIGIVLVVVGVGWLAQTAGLLTVTWPVLLSAALIGLGAALVFTARRATSAMVVVLGVIMAAVLAATTTEVNLDAGVLRSGAGDRLFAPARAGELEASYATAAGDLVLDLTDIADLDALEGERRVEAKIGVGDLRVIVPEGLAVQVHASLGAGDVSLFGQRVEGVGVSRSYTDPSFATADRSIVLHLSGAAGHIEVVRAR